MMALGCRPTSDSLVPTGMAARPPQLMQQQLSNCKHYTSMARVGQIRVLQAQATVFPVEVTVYTACIPYKCSKSTELANPEHGP